MPPLTFLILVLHVLQSSWGRSEVAKTVPLIHGMKGNDRKTQRQLQAVTYQGLRSLGKGHLAQYGTELRVSQDTLPKGPGGFCTQHDSLNYYYK